MNILVSYLPVLILPILIAYFVTPLVILLAEKIGIVDDPNKNKHPKVIHTYPVPRGGGIAPLIAILVSSIVFIPLDKHIAAILFASFLIVLLGVLDDKYNINPYVRIISQLLIVSLPIASGIGIAFTTIPFGSTLDLTHLKLSFNILGSTRDILVIADLFAVLWITFLMNMLNMGAKGVDGQLPGVVTISALVIAILSLRYSADITQWPVTTLALITAGAFLGFLPWNFYPQKIMPSYSGSTLAGFLLGVLSILSTAKVGTLIVVLGIPLIDTGYTIVRRLLQGKSPVWGDRGHLHHRLYDAGVSKRNISLLYWMGTALLGVLALKFNAQYKLYTLVGLGFIIGGIILWLTRKPQK